MVSQRYSWLTLAELKTKCAQGDISSEGTTAQLRQALITWDELNAQDMNEKVASTFTSNRRMDCQYLTM